MNSRWIKSRVRSISQDLCQIFVGCFTCFIFNFFVNLIYLFWFFKHAACFFPILGFFNIIKDTLHNMFRYAKFSANKSCVFVGEKGGVLLVTKCLKIPFKTGIFLSCLLRLDPWIWCLFSYWMSHRSVLCFLLKKSKQKEMGGNSRLHLWKQNGEILFFRKMSPEI